MTKQEAINYINSLDDKSGIIVLSIQECDIEEYAEDNFKAGYRQLNEADRLKVLSGVADQMDECLEEHPDFGCRRLLETAINGETPHEVLDYVGDK